MKLYLWTAIVLGVDGMKYCVSHKGIESEKEIIEVASKFYGKKMDKVVEYR